MRYNFIRLNLTNTYATVIDKNSLPRYMCFKDSMSARNCVSHICHYRSKHGHWPTFDLSEEKHRIERKETPKERKPEDLYKYFDIVTLDEDELNNVCHAHYPQHFLLSRIRDRTAVRFRYILGISTQDIGRRDRFHHGHR